MRVSIHQPQYLPWVPYFLKIEASDAFILLDTVDFQKNGLQNRNQIKTAQGAHWLTVPVKQQLGQKIRDVQIDHRVDWRRKHWQTIQQCYRKAAAFTTYENELESVYVREWSRLSDLTIALTTLMLRWMNIQTTIRRSSEMNATGTASDLVLNLCKEAGATCYVSGTGAKSYLQPEAFEQAGIEIEYRPSVLPASYPQLFPQAGFLPELSALDIVLNCGTAWRDYLPNAGLEAGR